MKIKRINLRKSVISFMVMLCLFGALPLNHVSAQEEASGGAKLKNENDLFMREENVIKNLKKKRNQLSQSQKKDLDAKIKILNEENSSLRAEGNVYGSLEDDDELVSTETIYPARKLKMKSCKQINGYYCGPATTKQTLQYITGKSYKQGDITIANAPPIARLKFEQKEDNNWQFSTKGHYLNISGYNRGMKKVQLTDPNIRRLFGNDATGKYEVTIKELRQALIDHPSHHLYW